MDTLVDFEELIELNVSSLSISQRSAQEPIVDILDKMCEAIDEKVIDNVLTVNQNEIEFDSSDTATTRYGEGEIEMDNDMLNCDPNGLGDRVADHPDDDIIDLDEFKSFYENARLFIDDEDLTDNCDNNTHNVQQIACNALHELPVKLTENGTEHDVAKNENTTSKKSTLLRAVSVHSVEYPPAAHTRPIGNCIDLQTLELNTVKPVFITKTEIYKEHFENPLETTTAEYKHDIDINKYTENTDRNDNNGDRFKKEYEKFVTEYKDTNDYSIETDVIKDYNEAKSNNVLEPTTKCDDTLKIVIDDSDDGFDISDFEFISEHEASKAIVTKITRNEILDGNNTVINKDPARNTDNIDNRLPDHNIQVADNYTPSTPNNDNKPRNNEASMSNDSDSDDGFDISDFEFIGEQEASKAGIVTKNNETLGNNTVNKDTVRNTDNIDNRLPDHNIQVDNYGPSTSNNANKPRKNEASWSDYVKYSKHRYHRCYSHKSHPTSDLHVIPEGERYLDMFRGQYAPVVVNNLYSLKNKRALSTVAMAVSIEELAYRDPEDNGESEKYKDDADDCLKKILSAYPGQNRRKRRRH